jgi:membrane fusion protein (multidrug efflux system)
MNCILATLTWVVWFPATVGGQAEEQYPGYAEAILRANVATMENGTIAELLVKKGDFVEAGQPLVRLDSDVQQAQWRAAQHEAQNTAEIRLAEARVQLVGFAVAKLKELVASGNARPLELEREEAELEMAKATLQLKRHEYQARQLQLDRAWIELEKRTIRAPFAGYVVDLPRQVGEFVSINQADVAVMVDANLLEATFAVPAQQLSKLTVGQIVEVLVDGRSCKGEVSHVGLVMDRSSQTISICVKFDNALGTARPGVDCLLLIP